MSHSSLYEVMFPANLLTDAKHSAFSTNHLTDIDRTKHNCNQQQDREPKLPFQETTHICT